MNRKLQSKLYLLINIDNSRIFAALFKGISMSVRVRFAPSPTGPLHIGGVRTALYNYLFAKKNKGTFVLRIEDTDQQRYVPGAEDYINEALQWFGLIPDESPLKGGPFGPYRQSERKEIYKAYSEQLLASGNAYYAFDTPEELDQARAHAGDAFMYGPTTRMKMKNSLTVDNATAQNLIDAGRFVIRLKIPNSGSINFYDVVRGSVSFDCSLLDDKVILKADGMPTYHLANVVDDHLMQITHVIRGEEWLPSTPHHVLMYQFLGWEAPQFCHLPLILKPSGQGKLSKRDGAKFGFPVFPLTWYDETTQEKFLGYKEAGYLPEAVLNFIVLLGWNPGTDQELFSKEEMVEYFHLDKIIKSGARFDIDKLKWFNQQYLISSSEDRVLQLLQPILRENNFEIDEEKGRQLIKMMRERVYFVQDIVKEAHYLLSDIKDFDQKTFDKKFKPDLKPHFEKISALIQNTAVWERNAIENELKTYINDQHLKMGDVLPVLRLCFTGTLQGPDLFDTIIFLGRDEIIKRLKKRI